MAGLTIGSLSGRVPDYYERKARAEAEAGRGLTNAEFEAGWLVAGNSSSIQDTGTSVFDPVLCELDYAWFSAPGDAILDPFAGGSVRGVVAERMGRRYTGIELRPEQVEANREQGRAICDECPEWVCGDSADMDALIGDREFDHVLTCPPYGDLEVYSDDPRDISRMDAESFDATYAEILRLTVAHLRRDRFATVVVGDYRDGRGMLRDLAGITVRAMEAAGASLYNDMVLVTQVGSLAVRVPRQFRAARKVGRRHQYVLNFVKGDPRAAVERLGDVEVPDVDAGEARA